MNPAKREQKKAAGLLQKGERRIAAALRIAFVVVLLLLQVASVMLLSYILKQRGAIIYGGLRIAGLAGAIAIYNRRGNTMYKFTWIMLILTAPVAGMILYLLWSGKMQSRRLVRAAQRRAEEPESVRMRDELNADKLAHAIPTWARVMNSLRRRGFSVYRDTKVTYYPEGKLFLEDLLAHCEKAERFIFLEYFILAEGKLWNRLFDILREKAAAGVEVKIIFDDFGNIKRFRGETIEKMREAGIEVFIFNPVHRYVNRLYFNYRDHRKLACIDGVLGYTGGVNFADEYANIITRFGYWKDSGIRLEGEGSWGLTKSFMDMLAFLSGSTRHEADYYRPHTDVRSEGWCQPFTDGPRNNPDNPALDTYLQLIANAKRFLYLTTPYFIPDEKILHALCVAGDGGVDVRLMLPAIPDHRYTDLVADSFIGELLEHGVKVYRFTPGFLHQKCVMVDREIAVVGSVNMDYRSFELHYECGVVLYGCPMIEDLLEDMDGIVEKSHLLTPEEWQGRKWPRRAVEPLLRLFAIWM
ncbi:MAG: cardiolipin synthase [Oscillospiraceae bacterium]|nr:cardiolipin synthase [Oscillospiraceae bacterium]